MGTFSLSHWLVVLLVVVIVFGAGKIPRLMSDLAHGIKSFKTTMKEDEPAAIPAKEAGKDRTAA